jgi:hypothetical protein
MGAYSYSGTAASNTSIDGIGAAGSNSPANLDDLHRAQAAALANFVRDLGGANTVGGTADAITITLADATTLPAYFDGMIVGFVAASDNLTTTPTLNVDSVGAKTIKKASAGVEGAVAAGDIQAGAYYLVRYRSAWATAAGAWELIDFSAASLPQSLSTADSPTFVDVTLTDDLSVADDILIPNTGSVINFGSGDITITYSSSNLLTGNNGQLQWYYNNASNPPVQFFNQADSATVLVATFDGDRATPTDGDAMYVDYRLSDSGGTQTTFGRMTITASDVTDATEDGKFEFSVMSAGSLTEILEFDNTGMALSRGFFSRGVPVTKTNDFTLGVSENWVIINKGSLCTVTLPAASSYPGREIMFKSITANGADSASSNVVPLGTATPGTTLLSTNDGAFCTIVSDGTDWIKMSQGS